MVMNRGQSGLLGKLGNKLGAAFEAHKGDDTKLNLELPTGIQNGIAQLVECKFDTYKQGDNAGQYFFYARGIVVQPTHVDGFGKVEGLGTSIIEALCDTPKATSRKTVDEHLAWILNEYRKLGIDTTSMSVADLEPIAQALKEAKPFFRFRTWQGAKQTTGPYAGQEPRVQHQWQGITEYTPADDGTGVDDLTGTTEEEPQPTPAPRATAAPAKKPSQPTPSKPVPAPAPNPGKKPTPSPSKPVPAPAKKAAPAPEPEESELPPGGYTDVDTEPDVDALLESANGGDEDAQGELGRLAVAAGWSEEEVGNAPDWDSVAEMVKTPQTTEEEPAPEPEEEPAADFKPETGDVYLYTPMDPKTKKPAKKPVECEVKSVDLKTKTVTLSNLDDPKQTYKAVKWDALQGAS